jgi:hypothetical protein
MKRSALRGVLDKLGPRKGVQGLQTLVDKLNQDWKVEAYEDNREVPYQKILLVGVWSAQLIASTFGAFEATKVGALYVRIFLELIKYLVWISVLCRPYLPWSIQHDKIRWLPPPDRARPPKLHQHQCKS